MRNNVGKHHSSRTLKKENGAFPTLDRSPRSFRESPSKKVAASKKLSCAFNALKCSSRANEEDDILDQSAVNRDPSPFRSREVVESPSPPKVLFASSELDRERGCFIIDAPFVADFPQEEFSQTSFGHAEPRENETNFATSTWYSNVPGLSAVISPESSLLMERIASEDTHDTVQASNIDPNKSPLLFHEPTESEVKMDDFCKKYFNTPRILVQTASSLGDDITPHESPADDEGDVESSHLEQDSTSVHEGVHEYLQFPSMDNTLRSCPPTASRAQLRSSPVEKTTSEETVALDAASNRIKNWRVITPENVLLDHDSSNAKHVNKQGRSDSKNRVFCSPGLDSVDVDEEGKSDFHNGMFQHPESILVELEKVTPDFKDAVYLDTGFVFVGGVDHDKVQNQGEKNQYTSVANFETVISNTHGVRDIDPNSDPFETRNGSMPGASYKAEGDIKDGVSLHPDLVDIEIGNWVKAERPSEKSNSSAGQFSSGCDSLSSTTSYVSSFVETTQQPQERPSNLLAHYRNVGRGNEAVTPQPFFWRSHPKTTTTSYDPTNMKKGAPALPSDTSDQFDLVHSTHSYGEEKYRNQTPSSFFPSLGVESKFSRPVVNSHRQGRIKNYCLDPQGPTSTRARRVVDSLVSLGTHMPGLFNRSEAGSIGSISYQMG